MNKINIYNNLKRRITKILLIGKERARKAVERERLQTYHEIGGLLHTHLVDQGENPQYGNQIVPRLAQDIGIGKRQLYDMLQFYRFFPKVPTSALLAWSHYRLLLHIPDAHARAFYLKEAEQAEWSVRELAGQIRSGLFKPALPETVPEPTRNTDHNLPALRGRLYTYRLLPSPDGNPRLDLGFKIHLTWPSTDLSPLTPGDRVQSTPRKKSRPFPYQFQPVRDRQTAYHTYAARLLHIVDGDTLRLDIDLGFGVRIDQRVRLRSIDTPEMKTPEGIRAKSFVQTALKTISTLAVTTTKPDKYDRYLADIFYLSGETGPEVVIKEGIFLNRELLKAGLAKRY